MEPPVKVLEIEAGVSGAYCGKEFRRLGARVAKVLPRQAQGAGADEQRLLQSYLDGGKRRLELNYEDHAGRVLLDRLASAADIVITAAPPRVVDQLDLLSVGDEHSPRVVVSITPFGLSGPYRDYEATEAILQALGGYSYLMGEPGQPPLPLPGHYAEYQAGLFAYTAAVAAWADDATSRRVVEVSTMEALAALHQFTTVEWTHGRQIRTRHGNRFSSVHPGTLYPTKSGWIATAITPNFWIPFLALIERPDLADDDRFATPAARVENADALDEILTPIFAQRTASEWFWLAQNEFRVPLSEALDIAGVLDNPQLSERDFWQEVGNGDAPIRYPREAYRSQGRRPTELPVLPVEHDAESIFDHFTATGPE